MKPLKYLLLTTFKNNIKELIKNPGKLILSIFLLVMFIFIIVISIFSPHTPPEELRNINELYAIAFLLYIFIYIIGSIKGLQTGASFYTMSDVNILFPSPISSKHILIYGLIKQMGMSLLLGLFLVFQYSWMRMSYGINFGFLTIVIFGYCLSIFSFQITAMAIYSYSSHSDIRKLVIKYLITLICIGIIAFVFIDSKAFTEGFNLDKIVASMNSNVLLFVPVAGWITALLKGIITANVILIILGATTITLFIFLFVYLLLKNNNDFYEDVLKATEVSHNVITARKEGKLNSIPVNNVKVGKTGINHGRGASTFFFKQMLENRRARVLIVDKMSLILIASTVIFGFFTKNIGIVSAFAFAIYMQFITIGTGKWVKELTLPFIYMNPNRSFVKLVMIIVESIIKSFIEGLIVFTTLGFIYSINPLEIIICILSYTSFGILLISVNILIERIMGSTLSKVLIMIIYFIFTIILFAPGLIIGLILSSNIIFITGLFTVVSTITIWNVLLSSLILYLCRNILNYAELNSR